MRLVLGRALVFAACVLMIVSSGFADEFTNNQSGNGSAISNGLAGTNELRVVPVNVASVRAPGGRDSGNLLERSLLGERTLDVVNSDGPDPKSLLVLGLSLGLALNVFQNPRAGQ
jgi:hypothetical protein